MKKENVPRRRLKSGLRIAILKCGQRDLGLDNMVLHIVPSNQLVRMQIDETIAELERGKSSTRFSKLVKICEKFFGPPRVKGSHHIFKTPWPGDPRLNLQSDKGKAKPYQIEQVIAALKKLDEKS